MASTADLRFNSRRAKKSNYEYDYHHVTHQLRDYDHIQVIRRFAFADSSAFISRVRARLRARVRVREG